MLIGKIEAGLFLNSVAMMKAKTASTIQIRNEITIKNSTCTRRLMTCPAISPIDLPLWRKLMTRAEKSCIAPMNTVPTQIQMSAGSQPQITAIAGPTMGAAPAIDAK